MLLSIVATAAIIAATPSQDVKPIMGYLPAGNYRLIWDDTLDDKLEGNKNCDLRLLYSGHGITGSFSRLSGERSAALEGRVEQAKGTSHLFTFTQVESDYICGYQMIIGPRPETFTANGHSVTAYKGVWQDVRGGRGDFALLRYQ